MVLVAQPEKLKAHEAMGLVHLEQKHYPLAVDEFQFVLSRESGQPKTRYLLGLAFLEGGIPNGRSTNSRRRKSWIPQAGFHPGGPGAGLHANEEVPGGG